MANPKINKKASIVILNWNGLADTVECIESLRKISYPNYEIIIVDNASSNNEAETIQKKYPEAIVIKNPNNEGFCKGNNIGAQKALENSADYVLFLNNDTSVEKGFLDELIGFCENNRDTGIAGPLVLNYYEKDKVYSCGGKLNSLWFSLKEYRNALDAPQKNLNFISGCAFLIRTSAIKKIGMWDENFFTYWEEADYCLRAEKAGIKIACIPKSIVYHKIAKTSKYLSQGYVYYMTRNNLLIAKKHARRYCWPFILTNFFIRRVAGYLLKLSIAGNLGASPAILRGIEDFILKKYGKRH